MPHIPPELQDAASTVGLTIDAVLRRTDKTLLARGSFGRVAAAVKYLVDPDPFWAVKWRHELDVYQIFEETTPPVRVPRLLHTDHDRLLILEWVDAAPVADERYPQHSLGAMEVNAVLRCITTLNEWTAETGRFSPTFDYPDRLTRYHAKGYLTDDELDALHGLLSTCGTPAQVNHGDPLASNILIEPAGSGREGQAEATAVLLDWEFTGLFLPGLDLAMLHTQLGASTPKVRERIDAIVEQAGIQGAFAVNLAIVLTREMRLHRELPEADPIRTRCLPIIDAAWAAASARLQRLASRRPT